MTVPPPTCAGWLCMCCTTLQRAELNYSSLRRSQPSPPTHQLLCDCDSNHTRDLQSNRRESPKKIAHKWHATRHAHTPKPQALHAAMRAHFPRCACRHEWDSVSIHLVKNPAPSDQGPLVGRTWTAHEEAHRGPQPKAMPEAQPRRAETPARLDLIVREPGVLRAPHGSTTPRLRDGPHN